MGFGGNGVDWDMDWSMPLGDDLVSVEGCLGSLCYEVQLDFLIVIGAVSDISDALVTTMSLIMVNAWFLIPNERSAWIIILFCSFGRIYFVYL